MPSPALTEFLLRILDKTVCAVDRGGKYRRLRFRLFARENSHLLRQNFLDDVAVDVGQAAVGSVESIAELGVIDAHQV